MVTAEIREGDSDAAAKRVEAVKGIEVLTVSDESERVAKVMMREAKLPERVGDDIVQLAVAIVYGMDFLLTWNFSHIANPHWLKTLARIVTAQGYEMPVVCDPQAMLEGDRK